jgi:hypothetical protein
VFSLLFGFIVKFAAGAFLLLQGSVDGHAERATLFAKYLFSVFQDAPKIGLGAS